VFQVVDELVIFVTGYEVRRHYFPFVDVGSLNFVDSLPLLFRNLNLPPHCSISFSLVCTTFFLRLPSQEDDELSLGDFLKKFIAVLQHSTKKVSKGKLTEAALLECYGKVTSTLDVAVSNGAVHTLDVTELEQFLRLDAVSKEKEKDKKDKKA